MASKTSNEGWIGVDLDKTLAQASGPITETFIGDPVPSMKVRVDRWLREGKDVRIFTARVDGGMGALEMGYKPFEDVELCRRAVQDWTEKHFGKRLPVTNVKDCAMKELWDDRAISVRPNTGEVDSFEKMPIQMMVSILVKTIIQNLSRRRRQ